MLSDDFTNLLDSSALNINDTVSEWLRRWTRNPLGSARVGSNPTGVDFVTSSLLELRRNIIRCSDGVRL